MNDLKALIKKKETEVLKLVSLADLAKRQTMLSTEYLKTACADDCSNWDDVDYWSDWDKS